MVALARKLASSAGIAAAVYAVVVRPRIVHWGATPEEVANTFPGAELIPDGIRASTMGVTIDAPPAAVWPWLIQMGADRAGWYSWDRLDNGGHASADQVHPEWQDLSVGDWLSAWSPRGPMKAWEVVALEPNRFLGLRGLTDLRGRVLDPTAPRPSAYTEGLWAFLLAELPGDRCRLVVSGYQAMRPRWLERFVNWFVYPPVHWVMQTRQFANLKRNVEASRAAAVVTPEAERGHDTVRAWS